MEIELREEISRLKSERLTKESQISRLELTVSEKLEELTELQARLRLVCSTFLLVRSTYHLCGIIELSELR